MRTIDFESTVRKNCERILLSPSADRLIVALSGGADSVALLLSLHASGFALEAAHCNFHLRGDDADRDEEFVRRLCKENDIPLHRIDFNTFDYAEKHRLGIEAAARELRYNWFDKLVQESVSPSHTFVAVAHHRQDQAETFFLQLMRGAGLKGLSGMAEREGRIVRPLLSLERSDIESYLALRGQDYCIDYTNADTAYRRNALRHDVLPLLRDIHPQFDRLLTLAMARMGEAERHQRAYALSLRQVETTDDGLLQRLSLAPLLDVRGDIRLDAKTLLYFWLEGEGFTTSQLEDILRSVEKGNRGALFETDSVLLTICGDALELSPRTHLPLCKALHLGENLFNGRSLLIEEYAEVCGIERRSDVAFIAKEKISGQLVLRHIEEGDRFQPFGMRKGTKLLSDYLTDRHYSRLRRRHQLCVCDDKGIVWLVGHTIAQRVAIGQHTHGAYVLKWR